MRFSRLSLAAGALTLAGWIPAVTARPVWLGTRGLGDLSGLLSQLPSPGELLDSSIMVLTELVTTLKKGQINQNGLATLMHMNTTANGTTSAAAANTSCPSMAVLFARGTKEPGNVGFLAGPPFFTALQNYMNGTANIAVQGVDYPASLAGFAVGGSPDGAAEMARLTNETLGLCPGAALVLAGYSQGAQVVHLAAAQLPNTTMAKVSSVVLFGDPRNGTAVQGVDAGRTMVVCHAGDNICQGGDLILPAHLNYSSDATAAAMFVMQKSRLGLASADAMNNGMGNVPSMSNPKASG
jgi:cutinase